MHQISCVLEKVNFNKDSYLIGRFKPDLLSQIPQYVQIGSSGNTYGFKGNHMLGSGNLEKTRLLLDGKWENDKRFGWTFNCSLITMKQENDLFFFLVKFITGVGPVLADHMIKSYGNDNLIDMIENRPKELLGVKGIGPVLHKRIISSWRRFSVIREVSSLLLPAGISPAMIHRVCKFFEKRDNLVSDIKTNPYMLLAVPGIAFKKCDEFALKLGIDPKSPLRIMAGINYCIDWFARTNGDTFVNKSSIIELMKNEVSIMLSPEDWEKHFQSLIDQNMIVDIGHKRIVLKSFYDAELLIYEFIQKRRGLNFQEAVPASMIETFIDGLEDRQGFNYNKEQRHAIKEGNTASVLCVAGIAGSGKTTCSHGIISVLSQKYAESSFFVTALSGIATDRIRKATGYQGGTIQSLLVKYEDEEYMDIDVLIIDEASMIPSVVLAKLLNKVHQQCRVIFIGDPCQLDPVGPGSPFSDILSYSKVRKTNLIEPNRQSAKSTIISIANDVRQGVFPRRLYDHANDFVMVQRFIKDYPRLRRTLSDTELSDLKEQSYSKIKHDVSNYFGQKAQEIFNDLKISDFESFLFKYQLITPQKINQLGSKEFNKCIQKAVNPIEGTVLASDRNFLAKNDKVVHTMNIDMPFMSLEDFQKDPHSFTYNEKSRIFNGFIGVVMKIDPEGELLWVYYPLDEKVVIYQFNDVKSFLELGYALTVHKSQGSEYQNIVIPMNLIFYKMLNTRLLYTAVTRAKSHCTIIGDSYALKVAVDNIDSSARSTLLQLLFRSPND